MSEQHLESTPEHDIIDAARDAAAYLQARCDLPETRLLRMNLRLALQAMVEKYDAPPINLNPIPHPWKEK